MRSAGIVKNEAHTSWTKSTESYWVRSRLWSQRRTATGQRGLVCQYDVICFDEISGVSFDSKDGVNIMKGYMASGEFSRGKDSIRAEGGIVLVPA